MGLRDAFGRGWEFGSVKESWKKWVHVVRQSMELVCERRVYIHCVMSWKPVGRRWHLQNYVLDRLKGVWRNTNMTLFVYLVGYRWRMEVYVEVKSNNSLEGRGFGKLMCNWLLGWHMPEYRTVMEKMDMWGASFTASVSTSAVAGFSL
jgi:hypothetical protein